MREKLARGRGGGMYSVVGLVEGGGRGGKEAIKYVHSSSKKVYVTRFAKMCLKSKKQLLRHG